MTYHKWLEIAKRIHALADAGLHYSDNPFDIERYNEYKDIANDIIEKHTDLEKEEIERLFIREKNYPTPKSDVRAIVFKEDKILLIREKADDKWAPPGGWADIGYTPKEVAVKETKEESGLEVKPVRLLAVHDKKCRNHPPSPFYVYKFFILCEITGGNLVSGIETSDAGFFSPDELPDLSKDRILKEQIDEMFDLYKNPQGIVNCD